MRGLVCCGFALCFGALFAQFPLTHSLPGNCDSWLAIAYSNLYVNYIKAAWTGQDLGAVLYQAANVGGFGESAVGSAAFFIAPKLFGASDLVAFYMMLVVMFPLSAIAALAVSRQYTGDGLVSG